MNLNDYTYKYVDKMKGDFAFSATNNEIRISQSLLKDNDSDNDIIKEEGTLAQQFYKNEVATKKANGEKVSPSKIKNEALAHAKTSIINKIGAEEYARLHTATGVKIVVTEKHEDKVSVIEKSKPEPARIELDPDILAEEFDHIEEEVVLNKAEVDIPADLPGHIKDASDLAKEPRNIEDIQNSFNEDDFDAFDVEMDADLLGGDF